SSSSSPSSMVSYSTKITGLICFIRFGSSMEGGGGGGGTRGFVLSSGMSVSRDRLRVDLEEPIDWMSSFVTTITWLKSGGACADGFESNEISTPVKHSLVHIKGLG